MKSKQRGFALEVTAIVMVLVFAGIIGSHQAKGEKAPDSPPTKNYNQ